MVSSNTELNNEFNAASAAQDKLEQMNVVLQRLQSPLQCTICLDLLSSPVTTKCGHTYCSPCIHKLLQSVRGAAPCPLCLAPVTKRSLAINKRVNSIVASVRNVIDSIKKDCGFFETSASSKCFSSPGSSSSVAAVTRVEDNSDEEENDEPRRGTRNRAPTSYSEGPEDLFASVEGPGRRMRERKSTQQNSASNLRTGIECRAAVGVTRGRGRGSRGNGRGRGSHNSAAGLASVHQNSNITTAGPPSLQQTDRKVTDWLKDSSKVGFKVGLSESQQKIEMANDTKLSAPVVKSKDAGVGEESSQTSTIVFDVVKNDNAQPHANAADSNSKVSDMVVQHDIDELPDITSSEISNVEKMSPSNENKNAVSKIESKNNSPENSKDYEKVKSNSFSCIELTTTHPANKRKASSKDSSNKNSSTSLNKKFKDSSIDDIGTECSTVQSSDDMPPPGVPLSRSTRSLSKLGGTSSRGGRPTSNTRYASNIKSQLLLLDQSTKIEATSIGIKDTKSPGWSHIAGAQKDLRSRHVGLNITGGSGKAVGNTNKSVDKLDTSPLVSSVETDVIDEQTQMFDVEHLEAMPEKKENVDKLRTLVRHISEGEEKEQHNNRLKHVENKTEINITSVPETQSTIFFSNQVTNKSNTETKVCSDRSGNSDSSLTAAHDKSYNSSKQDKTVDDLESSSMSTVFAVDQSESRPLQPSSLSKNIIKGNTSDQSTDVEPQSVSSSERCESNTLPSTSTCPVPVMNSSVAHPHTSMNVSKPKSDTISYDKSVQTDLQPRTSSKGVQCKNVIKQSNASVQCKGIGGLCSTGVQCGGMMETSTIGVQCGGVTVTSNVGVQCEGTIDRSSMAVQCSPVSVEPKPINVQQWSPNRSQEDCCAALHALLQDQRLVSSNCGLCNTALQLLRLLQPYGHLNNTAKQDTPSLAPSSTVLSATNKTDTPPLPAALPLPPSSLSSLPSTLLIDPASSSHIQTSNKSGNSKVSTGESKTTLEPRMTRQNSGRSKQDKDLFSSEALTNTAPHSDKHSIEDCKTKLDVNAKGSDGIPCQSKISVAEPSSGASHQSSPPPSRRFKRIRPVDSDSSSDEHEESEKRKKTSETSIIVCPKRGNIPKIVSCQSSYTSDIQELTQDCNQKNSEEMRLDEFDDKLFEYYGFNDKNTNNPESVVDNKVNDSFEELPDLNRKESVVLVDEVASDPEDVIPGTAEVLKNVAADISRIKKMRSDKLSQETIMLSGSIQSEALISSQTKALLDRCNKSLLKAEQQLRNTPVTSMEETLSGAAPGCSEESLAQLSILSTQSAVVSTQYRDKVQHEVEQLKAKMKALQEELNSKEKNRSEPAGTEEDLFSSSVASNTGSGALKDITSAETNVAVKTKSVSVAKTKASIEETLTRPKVFMCTGLSVAEAAIVNKVAQKVGGQVLSRYDERVTHVIVRCCPDGTTDRTYKYLCAVASGCWVLNITWAKECLQKNKIVEEGTHEALDSTGVPGPERGRLHHGTLLKGARIYCDGPFTEVTVEQLSLLVTLCGGKIVESVEELTVGDAGGLQLIVLQVDEEDDDRSRAVELYDRHQRVVVASDWLIECVGMYALIGMEPYLLCEPDVSVLAASGVSAALIEETQDIC